MSTRDKKKAEAKKDAGIDAKSKDIKKSPKPSPAMKQAPAKAASKV
jgi:hypothetical protein